MPDTKAKVSSRTAANGDEITRTKTVTRNADGQLQDKVKTFTRKKPEAPAERSTDTLPKVDSDKLQGKAEVQNNTGLATPNTSDPDKPLPVNPQPKPAPKSEPTPTPNTEPKSTPEVPPHDRPGLDWFKTNWKTIAIIAGATAALAALAALIKSLDKNIKIRFQRCANTLQRMQKDFTLSKNGLDMKAVLPGIGSGIMDKFARVWTGIFKKNKAKKGAIGLYPFCDAYCEEIANDYKLAEDAYNKIKQAAEESANNPSVGESYNIRYNSFREAFAADNINESVVNESVAIGTTLSLGALAVRGGMFLISKIKDGKIEKGSGKEVQVTKESTREICYAIMNNFFGKYINMEGLMKKIGVNASDLSELDASSVDKMKKVLEAYGTASEKNITGQYARIKTSYDTMLKHYLNIGYGIIKNFDKYNKDLIKDEKHANLALSAKEKLEAMWDKQKEIYENNFSHVVLAIVKSPEYTNYLNFILERVIPVFKSGLAGDADYILDVMPKEGEQYVVRQTLHQDNLKDNEQNLGNIALAEITKFNKENNKISFKLIGLVKSDIEYNEDGTVTIKDMSQIDASAYGNDNEQQEVEYGKWLALDPHLLNGSVSKEKKEDNVLVVDKSSKLYVRETETKRGRKIKEYIFAIIETAEENLELPAKSMENKLNEDGEQNEPAEITATDAETNTLKISHVICCNINSDSDIFKEVTENKFSGSYIDIDPDCSIEDYEKKIESLEGFEDVDENAGKIKARILNLIHHVQSSIFTATVTGKYEISNIEKPIDIIENRETAAEKLIEDKDEIADKIMKAVSVTGVTFDIAQFNNKGSFSQTIGRGWRLNPEYATNKRPGGSIDFDTEINDDQNQGTIKFTLYPTLLRKSDGKLLPANEMPVANTVTPGIIISIANILSKKGDEADLHYTCLFDKSDIADKGILAITKMLIAHAQAEDVRGITLNTEPAKPEEQPQQSDEERVKKLTEKVNKVCEIFTKVVTLDASGNFNLTNNAQNNAQYNYSNDGKVSISVTPEKCVLLITGIKFVGSNTNNAINVNIEHLTNNNYTVSTGNSAANVNFNNINELPAAMLNSLRAMEKNKVVYESVNLVIEYTAFLNESYETQLIRNISLNNIKDSNLYVLSETAWGDGTQNPINILEKSTNAIKLYKTYDNIAAYAKKRSNVRFAKLSESSVYSVIKPVNMYNMLTIGNPLYESVILVKFNNNNITNIYNAGIHKIVK